MRRVAMAVAGPVPGLAVAGTGVSPVAAGEALDEPSPPDRAPALVTVETPDYDFELILEDFQGHTSGSVRRTDDLDNWFDSDGRPDRYGLWQRSDWGVTGGSRCLTSGGGLFAWFSDGAPPHAFTYGAAGRNVARFD